MSIQNQLPSCNKYVAVIPEILSHDQTIASLIMPWIPTIFENITNLRACSSFIIQVEPYYTIWVLSFPIHLLTLLVIASRQSTCRIFYCPVLLLLLLTFKYLQPISTHVSMLLWCEIASQVCRYYHYLVMALKVVCLESSTHTNSFVADLKYWSTRF